MDTKNKQGASVQGNATATKTPATVNPANINTQGEAKPTPEAPKADDHKGQEAQKAEEPKPQEQPKPQTAIIQMQKKAMSIDERLKALELLTFYKSQYFNLLKRMEDLEAFEFKLMEDADELQENHFAGCRLIIQDGKGGQFSTTTPNLVKMTHSFLLAACLDKKTELEEKLVFPNAA